MRIKTDIAVVGAGLMGSSVAMHLVDPALAGNSVPQVTVLDVDLEGSLSSSELNAGGVRALWNHPLNVEISKRSIEYYLQVSHEVGFRELGYFWMYGKERWTAASRRAEDNAKRFGLQIELLDPKEITRRYSFIDKTDDLGGATFSPQDGLLNPNLLKLHYRKQAALFGANFMDRVWIQRIEADKKHVRLSGLKYPAALSVEDLQKILADGVDPLKGEPIEIEAKALIHCSGAWACRFLQQMNKPTYSHAVRRQVSLFECKEVDLTPYGMFVDASGTYFHPEAKYILSGYAIEDEPEGFNFHYDGECFFERYIWPSLYERSSKFESLKHVTGWAGLYEVSKDRCGIVGRVPGLSNVFEAHSFSGRGVMQSWAVGRGLAELVLKDKFLTIDLAPMSAERFEKGELLREDLLI